MGIKASVEGVGRNSREAARIYLGLGLGPIPIPRGQKAPTLPAWPELRLTEADLPRYFTNGENIGLLLGEASKGLIDSDLDCPEAVAVAEPTPKYRKFSDLEPTFRNSRPDDFGISDPT